MYVRAGYFTYGYIQGAYIVGGDTEDWLRAFLRYHSDVSSLFGGKIEYN